MGILAYVLSMPLLLLCFSFSFILRTPSQLTGLRNISKFNDLTSWHRFIAG